MELLTKREIEIMNAIWFSGKELVQTGEILNTINLERKLSRQPLQSMLTRLCEKGVLECVKEGHFNFYRSQIDREEYRKFETALLMKRLYKNSPKSLVLSLVKDQSFTAEDIKELQETFGMISQTENS